MLGGDPSHDTMGGELWAGDSAGVKSLGRSEKVLHQWRVWRDRGLKSRRRITSDKRRVNAVTTGKRKRVD